MVEYWELKINLPNAENERVVNEFLLSKKNLNRNPDLIANYQRVLQHFFEERFESFSSVTEEDIHKWTKGKPPYLEKILRIFYNYYKSEGYLEKTPFKNTFGEITELKRILPNAENQKIVNEYLLNMKELGRRENTIVGHRKSLQHFFRDQEESFRSLASSDIKTWISHQEKSWKKETLYIRLCILRTFYYYCMCAGLIQKNPVIPFIIKRKKKRGWSKPIFLNKQKKYWKIKMPLSNPENENVINEYLLSLKVSNYSMATLKTYRKNLNRFFKNRKKSYTSLESKDIQEWINENQKGWKESTLYTHLSILDTFFNYCVEEGYVEKNIIKKRWYPRYQSPYRNT